MKPLIPQSNKILERLTPMSPSNMYKELVRSVTDGTKASLAGVTYYPSQFGGLQGQYSVLTSSVALKLVDFDLTNQDTTSNN